MDSGGAFGYSVREMRRSLSLVLLACFPICAQPPLGPPTASPPTPDQWRADLAVLAKELPSRHKNAFATISKSQFEAEVKDLDSRIAGLDEGAVKAELLKIVASIGDGHTTLRFQRGFHAVPL